jgi:hypothetical protein
MNRNLLLLVLLFMFGSCSEKSEKKAEENVQVKSVNTVIDPKVQKLENLRSLTPMDLDQSKNFLPEEINGIKRSHFSVSSGLGYGMAHADYEKNNKSNFRITLYDCSGESGANLFESIYWNRLNQQKEDENAVVKTVDISGGKAIQKTEKGTNITTLTYFANNRLLVIISGKDVDGATLEANTKSLPLKIS